MTRQQSRRRPVAKFVAAYVVALTVFSVLLAIMITIFPVLKAAPCRFTAWVSAKVLGAISSSTQLQGTRIISNGFTVDVVFECTGIFEILAVGAGVLAFPTSLRKKMLGILASSCAIYVFNLVRIVALVALGSRSYDAFQFAHLYLWQISFVFLGLAVWYAWFRFVVNDGKRLH